MHSLKSLQEFTLETDKGLLNTLKVGDYEGLVKVMKHLLQVREKQGEYDSMFEQLNEILSLLKEYAVELPGNINILMEV